MVISSLAAIMPPNRREIDPPDQFLARLIRGKSTYPNLSDLPNHLAKRWLVQMLVWQGHSIAETARRVRTTDVTVSKWLAGSRTE